MCIIQVAVPILPGMAFKRPTISHGIDVDVVNLEQARIMDFGDCELPSSLIFRPLRRELQIAQYTAHFYSTRGTKFSRLR
jgi:hypothetical protein